MEQQTATYTMYMDGKYKEMKENLLKQKYIR